MAQRKKLAEKDWRKPDPKLVDKQLEDVLKSDKEIERDLTKRFREEEQKARDAKAIGTPARAADIFAEQRNKKIQERIDAHKDLQSPRNRTRPQGGKKA